MKMAVYTTYTQGKMDKKMNLGSTFGNSDYRLKV